MGGLVNADRGTDNPSAKDQRLRHRCGPRPVARLRTAARCSTRSAATRVESRPSNRRSRSLVTWYGGLATTRNGRRGNRRARTSASITRTGWSANRSRSRCARSGCSSTASTRAPAATRCRVSAPCPAPRSSTSSPGRTPASATIRAAHASVSGCQPQWPASPGAATPHRQEDSHAATVFARDVGRQRIIEGSPRRNGRSPRPASDRRPPAGNGRRPGSSPSGRPGRPGPGSAPLRR